MKKKILIADDDWPILELLKMKLSSCGFDVLTAKDGKELCERAGGQHPDLLILDLWLPDGIGTNFYEELLRQGLSSDTPVIFISALAHDQRPKLSPSGGRFALFGKPFDCYELIDEVQKLLEEPERKDQAAS